MLEKRSLSELEKAPLAQYLTETKKVNEGHEYPQIRSGWYTNEFDEAFRAEVMVYNPKAMEHLERHQIRCALDAMSQPEVDREANDNTKEQFSQMIKEKPSIDPDELASLEEEEHEPGLAITLASEDDSRQFAWELTGVVSRDNSTWSVSWQENTGSVAKEWVKLDNGRVRGTLSFTGGTQVRNCNSSQTKNFSLINTYDVKKTFTFSLAPRSEGAIDFTVGGDVNSSGML